MFGIGAGEFVIILIAGLIIFGPGKLPEVGRALGKALREFRKAQAAFSATLNEVSAEPKKDSSSEKSLPEKNSSTENSSGEKNSGEKVSIEKKSDEEKNSDDKKISDEKISGDEKSDEKIFSPTTDDIIKMAKENPIVKESTDEKISYNPDSVVAPGNDGSGNTVAASDGHGTGK